MSTVKSLLHTHIGNSVHSITGNSFRAGIPSAPANSPNLASDDEVKRWGRRSGNSYQAYTCLKHQSRKRNIRKNHLGIFNTGLPSVLNEAELQQVQLDARGNNHGRGLSTWRTQPSRRFLPAQQATWPP